jgi:thiol:disulfide interchange protein
MPIRDAILANHVLTLKADNTHEDPGVGAMMELLGIRQVPVLAIFPAGRPNEPIVFLDGYTQGMVTEALKGAGPSKPASR